MAVNSLLQTGVQGIQTSVQGLQGAASRIAQAGTTTDGTNSVQSASDLAESLVDMKLYERAAQASAKVVKTADTILGTLLDTTA